MPGSGTIFQGFLISPDQCRAARALLSWTQAELAMQAGTIRANVVLFERGQGASAATRRRLQMALEGAGVIFVRADASGGPGVVLRAAAGDTRSAQPYLFDASFYEAQARLIAAVARQPAYTELREGFLALSRDYRLHARQLAGASRGEEKVLGR